MLFVQADEIVANPAVPFAIARRDQLLLKTTDMSPRKYCCVGESGGQELSIATTRAAQ